MISNTLSEQPILDIAGEELLEEVSKRQARNLRLVQISCTKKDDFEITYSFEDGKILENVRIHVKEGEEVESVSGIYSYAFLYENEMKDLFGVRFKNLSVDFGGNLYKTSIITPFNVQDKSEDE